MNIPGWVSLFIFEGAAVAFPKNYNRVVAEHHQFRGPIQWSRNISSKSTVIGEKRLATTAAAAKRAKQNLPRQGGVGPCECESAWKCDRMMIVPIKIPSRGKVFVDRYCPGENRSSAVVWQWIHHRMEFGSFRIRYSLSISDPVGDK